MMDQIKISERKKNHLEISLDKDVGSSLTSGFENITLVHMALPEINLDDIDPTLEILAKKISFPLLISSMTGGTPLAAKINRNLAQAAENQKVALGIGSQRAAIEDPQTAHTFKVRSYAKTIPIFANLGAIQLNYSYGIDECQRAVDMMEADALILHLNPLQEALQPEGDTNFRGLLKKIEGLCKKLPVPVIAKEVGYGISREVANQLSRAGVWGIDVAGGGGTSWSQVEMYRSANNHKAQIAAAFRDWGIPTAESVQLVKSAAPKVKIIASGGIRSGVDIVKALAIGADFCGIALPFLKAATKSSSAVEDQIDIYQQQFRISMFSLGVRTLNELHTVSVLKS
jgi:isopentenyl-diphosphate delta-isomerase